VKLSKQIQNTKAIFTLGIVANILFLEMLKGYCLLN
jgi:hypothetical protein